MRRSTILLLTAWLVLGLFLGKGGFAASSADIPEIDAGALLKRIADESGKVVLINVFASWCPPCREEIPGLIKVRKAFSEKEVLILGISVDKEPKALTDFMQEMNISYPIMLARGDFTQRVGVSAVPQLLIYNKKGELVVNHKGLVDAADLSKALKEILAE
jgi:thiol-disulfide isomerase/thioredoxin